jgi:hypothetical protein
MGQSILLSELETNCGLTVLLKMGNTSHPLIAHRLLQELQIACPPRQADTVILVKSAIILRLSALG